MSVVICQKNIVHACVTISSILRRVSPKWTFWNCWGKSFYRLDSLPVVQSRVVFTRKI